jgi:hypothetical protein
MGGVWYIDTPHGDAEMYNFMGDRNYFEPMSLEPNQVPLWHIVALRREAITWILDQLSRTR